MEFKRGLKTPSLVTYIHSILNQYPDDGQILRELIQNADDAGAKTIKFLLDERSVDCDEAKLSHPELAKFQGAALYTYNDAVFSHDDWNDIYKMQASIKSQDPSKTGRFGLGFKSIFHITDLPTIVSGDYIGFIDPQEKFLTDQSSAWHLKEDSMHITKYWDQFKGLSQNCFKSDSFMEEGYYGHTLFRFPLRSTPSKLSEKPYPIEQVNDLFHSIIADDGQLLLFLKNVTTIEIYRHKQCETQAVLIHRVSLSTDLEKIRKEREQFLRQIQMGCESWNKEPVKALHKITIEIETLDENGVLSRKRHEWLVAHWCGTDGSTKVEELAEDLSLLPWIGLALPLNRSGHGLTTSGRIFASLPLPLDGSEDTGLPFYVHGFFAMEQNRRHLKWPTADQDITKLRDKSLQWNYLLVQKLFPCLVQDFLSTVLASWQKIGHQMSPEDIYAAMPDEDVVDSRWKPLVAHLYPKLFSSPCLYASAPHGKWVETNECFYLPSDMDGERRRIVIDNVCKAGIPLVVPPTHVINSLRSYTKKSLREVTPGMVKQAILRNYKDDNLPRESALVLLHYFWENASITDLLKLPLIPLLDGKMTSFKSADEKKIYLTNRQNPATLLPSLEARIIETELDESTERIFQKIAQSEKTQVAMLSSAAVLELLPEVDQGNTLDADLIEFGVGIYTLSWVEQVWDYLYQNPSTNQKVLNLRNLYLLPVSDGMLCRLGAGNAMVLRSPNICDVPDDVFEMLSHVGVDVLSNVPSYVMRNEAVTHMFIQPDNLKGILTALKIREEKDKVKMNKDLKSIWKDEEHLVHSFLTYLKDSGIAFLDSQTISLLKRLPLFKTVEGSGFRPSEVVSLTDVPYSAPSATFPVTFPIQVIGLSTTGLHHLVETLGVNSFHLSPTTTAYKEKLLPEFQRQNYVPDDLGKITMFYLDHFEVELKKDTKLLQEMVQTPCLPDITGSMHTPSELFDPSERYLSDIMDARFFPPPEFQTSVRLSVLRSLGLKNLKTIQPEEVIKMACRITDELKAESYLKVLTFLSKKNEFRENGEFWHEVSKVHFLPILQQRPTTFPSSLPWYSEGMHNNRKRPDEVFPVKEAGCLGSVLPLVEIEPDLLRLIKSQENTVPVEHVVHQLKLVLDHFRLEEKTQYMPLLDMIYDKMSNHSSDAIDAAREWYSLDKWIWSGQDFRAIDDMLLVENEIDFAPYLLVIPPEMKRHSSLLSGCGMEETADPLKVLTQISEAHLQARTSNQRVQTKPNVQRDLQLAISVLKSMEKGSKHVLVPIDTYDASNLQFCPASECTRRTNSDLLSDIEGVNYVHPSVPSDVCEALLIPSDITREADSEAIGVEACGQKEPLTRRLHSIIEGYTDGLSFIHEMIQNADDAGATEVKLVYDMRKNEDHCVKILNPAMKSWQGPAFWVYNDASFREEDFTNITMLNASMKNEMADKVGKFGLGFNAVYNVTDVPSFVSGEHMVIFDPHTTYLNDALVDKSMPGIKFKIANSRTNILQRFSDQFAPWNDVCGCDLQDKSRAYFNGTLFRLPFRKRPESMFSDISSTMYTKSDTQDLFKLILDHGDKLLLFTQNVVKFSASVIPEDSTNVRNEEYEVFSITKEPVRYIQKHGVDLQTTRQQEFLSEMSILKASKACRDKSIRASLLMKTNVTSTKNGARFLDKCSPSLQEYQWLVTNCAESSLQPTDPLVVSGAAIQVFSHGELLVISPLVNDENNPSGGYFCFLPLPISCSLPFHINGMFNLENSRRHLVMKSEHECESVGGTWNKYLMENGISPAIQYTLKTLVEHLTPSCNIEAILPCRTDGDVMLKILTETFWKTMFEQPDYLPIFCVPEGRITLKNAWFLARGSFNSDANLQKTARTIIKNRLHGSGQNIVEISEDVEEIMLQINEEFMKNRTINEETFLLEYFLCNVDRLEIPKEERDRFLVLGLTLNSKKVDSAYSYRSCIPAKCEYSHFRPPEELIHPSGKAAVLFADYDSRFPDLHAEDETLLMQAYQKLSKLGMTKDILSWEDMLERAENIAENGADICQNRPKCFVQYLAWRLDKGDDAPGDDSHINSLMLTKFIPAQLPPEGWDISWKGTQDRLYSGPELLFMKNYLIGCSKYPVPNEDLQLTKEVAMFLGMKCTIPIEDVVRQLQNIANQTTIPRSGIQREGIGMIYTHLEGCSRDQAVSVHVAELMSAEHLLYIADEDTFVASSKCSYSFEAVPYLFKMSENKYPCLYRALGVQVEFAPECLIEALCQIKEDVGNQVLDKDKFATVLKLLSELHRVAKKLELTVAQIKSYGKVYMPDTKSVVKPAGEMSYLDCPWVSTLNMPNLTHPEISYSMAKRLGAKDIRTHLLDGKSTRLGTPFGQKERLVDRIRSVLKAYPFGVQILLEFAQNADDAGATELHFILDRQTYKDEKIFTPSWSALQGPALCVFNNAKFTPADLEGIVAVGQGTKKDNPGKIGQFGVGLNSVYHLTNVQIICLAMEDGSKRLIALDPTCQYVRGVTTSEPGRLYTDLDTLRDIFPDVFSPLQEQTYKDGTFFRLPLHTSGVDRISSEFRSVQSICHLLDDFKEACVEALLFLTSLKEIHITKINEDGSRSTETITAELPEAQRQELDSFRNAVMKQAENYQQGFRDLSAIPVKTVSYCLTVQHDKRMEVWDVVQRCGSDDQPSPELQDLFRQGKLACLPVGGVACRKLSSGTTLCHGNAYTNGRVYASLPLPLESNLPLHINGHFMLDHESRQHLWGGHGDDYKKTWNEFICGHVITPCYAQVISVRKTELASILTSDSNAYHEWKMYVNEYSNIFPQYSEDKVCHEALVVKEICSSIAQMDVLPVISQCNNELQWVSVEGTKPGLFSPLKVERSQQQVPLRSTGLENDYYSIEEVLGPCSIPVTFLNENILKVLETHLNVQYISAQAVIEILRCQSVETLQRLNRTEIEKIIKFCQKDPEFSEKMDELPLLMTSAGHLHAFRSSRPVYKSKSMKLVCPESDEFLHPDFIPLFKDVQSDVFKEFHLHDFAIHFRTRYPNLISEVPIPWDENVITNGTMSRIWQFIMEDSKEGSDIPIPRNEMVDTDETVGQLMRGDSVQGIHVLDDLCLLPISKYEKHPNMLYPMKLAYTIISFGINPLGHISDPDYSIHSSSDINTWLQRVGIVASWDDPSSVAKAFLYYQRRGQFPNSIIANELIEYFSTEGNRQKLASSALDDLKQLCIFPTMDNKHCSGTGIVYVIPSRIPKDDMDSWIKSQESKFLDMCDRYLKLYDMLDFTRMEEEKMYRKIIVPEIEKGHIRGTSYWQHMFYMMDNFNEDPSFLESLSDTRIVMSRAESFCAASQLYDPQIKIFLTLEPAEMLPSDPSMIATLPSSLQRSPKQWFTFLKSIGLIEVVTAEKLCEYAKGLTLKKSQEHEQPEYRYTKMLLKYIEDSGDKELLLAIKDIHFIPRDETNEHKRLCPAKNTTEDLVALSGSVVKKKEDLLWSVTPVLPDWFSSEAWKEIGLESAGVITEPKCPMVIQHLVQLCEHNTKLYLKSYDMYYLEKAFNTCFKYLSDALNKGESLDLSKLSECTCILIPEIQKLVKPSFTFWGGYKANEVSPYLWKIPYHLIRFNTLLKSMGVVETLTGYQYQAALQIMFEEHGSSINEGRLKQVAYIIIQRIISSSKIDIDKEKELYMLSEAWQLHPASKLVLNNRESWRQRLNLPNPGINFILKSIIPAEFILDKLPPTRRPKKLSDILKEVIHDPQLPVSSSTQTEVIEEKIHSENVSKAVKRMVRHIVSRERKDQNEEEKYFTDLASKMCQILQNVKIYPVKSLKTVLKYSGGRECGRECGAVADVPLYMDEANTALYVKESGEQDWQVSIFFWMQLAEMIDKQTDGLFAKDRDKLMVILSESEGNTLLDRMGISMYEDEDE